ncbi:MAG: hypothetical protein QOJ63_777 [Solirubrobacteraceae bacterium]|nr:hypothetical protein [Solirubrobacteraceae bacterium]
MPEWFRGCFRVKRGEEIVLASDGYPRIYGSLAGSEAALATSLKADPLRIREDRTTKGVRPGHRSFDDRAFVRLRA